MFTPILLAVHDAVPARNAAELVALGEGRLLGLAGTPPKPASDGIRGGHRSEITTIKDAAIRLHLDDQGIPAGRRSLLRSLSAVLD